MASLAPSRFRESSTSTTSRSVVPLGAFLERKTSSRYQPSRAGMGLAADPTSRPSESRAVKYFFFSLCWNGSTVKSHANLIGLRRVVRQLLQRQAVSRTSRSSTLTAAVTCTPARRAWLTPARAFFARSPRGAQVRDQNKVPETDPDSPQTQGTTVSGKLFRGRHEPDNTTRRACFPSERNQKPSLRILQHSASGSPGTNHTLPNSL